MRNLSKSKLISFRQCPKRLWLEINRPDLREDSTNTRANFATGHQVGEIAQKLYDTDDTGVLIDPQAEGFSAAFERSKALLSTSQPIFEAGFTANGALAFADVMLPVPKDGGQEWRMIEVKASTGVKDYHRDDVAIQAFIARKAGVPLESIALAHIDSSWTYPGGGNYRGLLKEADLTDQAFSRKQEVESWIADAQRVVLSKNEPCISIENQCYSPFECGFIGYCHKDIKKPEHPASWIPNIRTNALKEYIETNSVTELKDAPDDLLNTSQLRVKNCTLSNTTYFDAQGAAADLTQYELPAYFIDFETIQLAIPIWKGTRPYQQICFQFSVHELTATGKLIHQDFLDLSGDDPSRAFAESLIATCGEQGPVFVYNAGFEKARIRELSERLPLLQKSLLAINERVVDLHPITKKHYYHPSQHGSWSIKKVLPAIVPDLLYSDLEGVQDGGMAQVAYLEAISADTSTDRRDVIRQQLLKYCELDTYAMVRIWQFFTGRDDITN